MTKLSRKNREAKIRTIVQHRKREQRLFDEWISTVASDDDVLMLAAQADQADAQAVFDPTIPSSAKPQIIRHAQAIEHAAGQAVTRFYAWSADRKLSRQRKTAC